MSFLKELPILYQAAGSDDEPCEAVCTSLCNSWIKMLEMSCIFEIVLLSLLLHFKRHSVILASKEEAAWRILIFKNFSRLQFCISQLCNVCFAPQKLVCWLCYQSNTKYLKIQYWISIQEVWISLLFWGEDI